MKTLPILALAVLLLAGGTAPGRAQDYGPERHSGKHIVELLRDHERRIREGEQSGELTRREADELRSKEDIYRAKLDDFLHRNGGFLTDSQEASLEESMRAMLDQIRSYKHNGHVR